MAEWQSPEHLSDHFRRHHRLLGVRTIAAYDASARAIIEVGTYFEYRDPDTAEPRVGYYEPATRRFTALSDDESTILTHFRCPERYVRDTLEGSTYP